MGKRILGGTAAAATALVLAAVVIAKQLDLEGQLAVLDASSSPDGYGIEVVGPGGSGSTVDGWTVTNAQFSGILVGSHIAAADGTPLTSGAPVSNVTIDPVVVVHDDRGFSGVVGMGAGECFTTPFAPGDCGEGIHLVSATNSVVDHALVADNAGGVLLSDEFGPVTGDVIRHVAALNNTDDCGITIASHTASQIYGNVIENNVADGNGVAGQGAGILLGGANPGTGGHDNVIRNNEQRHRERSGRHLDAARAEPGREQRVPRRRNCRREQPVGRCARAGGYTAAGHALACSLHTSTKSSASTGSNCVPAHAPISASARS